MTVNDKKKNTMGLKIISVVMAILLWFYVINQGQLAAPQNTRDVGLEYRNLGENLTVIGPDRVTVRLWGAFQETAQIVAYVDLSDLTAGTYVVRVQVEQIRGAMFTSVEPDRVEIEIQEEGQNIFPINYEIRQNPPSGFEISDIIISPERCLVRGEQEAVNRVATVTAQLDLGNVRDITTFRARLVARDIQGNTITEGIQIVPESVTVYAAVNIIREYKQVPIIPQLIGTLPVGYRVEKVAIEPDIASILGDTNRIENISELLTTQINIQDRTETFNKVVEINVPQGVRVIPSKTVVTIYIEQYNGEEVE